MKNFEKKGHATQTIYFPGTALKCAGTEPDFYISRLGEAQGNGQYKVTFMTPYNWGLIALEGEASLRVRNEMVQLKRGDLMILRAEKESYFEESAEKPFRYLWFDLTGPAASKTIASFLAPQKTAFFPGRGENCLKDLFDLRDAFSVEKHSTPQSVVCAWKLLEVISQQQTEVIRDPAHSCKVILETEFASAVSVGEIAEKLNINRSTLFRKFKANYGISPKQYLDQLKVEHARKLLKTTAMPIKQISFESGFDSIQHFYLMYKKTNGESPMQSRNLA
ncbi:MAG: AraC family transcriptional regulator [Lentisphaeraceae bacterium]|nr:AraC family transcriptional regulator [Lentisphaeraceae bacterium]